MIKPQVTFDWAAGKLTALFGDDDSSKIKYYPSIEELITSLNVPHKIVCEATFESFDISERQRMIDLATAHGHDWWVTPNRQTGRHRQKMGFGDNKTDEIDVQVLRDMSLTRPTMLKRPNVRLQDDPFVVGAKAANDELMLLRRTITMKKNKSKLGFKKVSAKDTYAAKLVKTLPKFEKLTEIQKLALGGSGKYSLCLVAAAAKVTKFANSREEFEHYAGLFAHGYPSQIRSDFMHWRYRFANKHGVKLSDFRRECRWLYHQLKRDKSIL